MALAADNGEDEGFVRAGLELHYRPVFQDAFAVELKVTDINLRGQRRNKGAACVHGTGVWGKQW